MKDTTKQTGKPKGKVTVRCTSEDPIRYDAYDGSDGRCLTLELDEVCQTRAQARDYGRKQLAADERWAAMTDEEQYLAMRDARVTITQAGRGTQSAGI